MKALAVALLEIKLFLRDKGDLAFAILLPISIFALMYGAFGGQYKLNVMAPIVNEDSGGIYSERLLSRLKEIDGLEVQIWTIDEAEQKLNKSDIYIAFYIPEDFSEKIAAGQQTEIIFKQHGNGGDAGQIVAGMVRGAADQINQELLVKQRVTDALQGSEIPQARINVTVDKFIERQNNHPVVETVERNIGNKPDMVKSFLPGIVTMFALFAISLSARALVEERKKGTMRRLMSTRLSIGQLFMGKFLAYIGRGFIQTFILFSLAYIILNIFTPVSFLECLIIALVFSAAASAIGLIIGSIAKTEDQATWIAVFFTMATTMLGGTFFEITKGSTLYTLSKLSLNTYANDAFKKVIVNGSSLSDTWLEITIMAGIVIVGLVISRLIFKVLPGGK
ncbi:MAG: ABC transporter permease [Chloroflexi bacterium]|nr:ABC transporter permease [Chloroflexota bacterium]